MSRMEPRRCGVHGLVVNADGRCVICRRGDPEVAAPKTSSELPLVIVLVVFAVLVTGSGAYWLSKKLTGSKATVDVPNQPAAQAPTASVQYREPELVRPMGPVGFDTPRVPSEIIIKPEPTSSALSQEEIDRRKQRVPVTMFVRPQCGLCDQAKLFMQARGYSLRVLDVSTSPTDEVELQAVNPAGTVPTFNVDDKILIGYDPNVLDATIEKQALKRVKR